MEPFEITYVATIVLAFAAVTFTFYGFWRIGLLCGVAAVASLLAHQHLAGIA